VRKNPLLSSVGPLLAVAITACAPGGAPAGQSRGEGARTAAPQPTVILASRGEPDSLATKAFTTTNGNFVVESIFNATMVDNDEQDQPQPFLSRDLPQLNTSSWTVAPDGKMVTTFNLKPNLTWHDGKPLTSEDFAFAHKVYSTPELGASRDNRVQAIEGIDAPSPTTVVIRWKLPFPDALKSGGYWALPKHILEEPLRTLDPAGFVSLPFWLQDYVGAGAYKVTEFRPGESIEMAAFDGYALGKPKIDKMRMIFIANAPTGVANLLAGTIHYAASFVIGPDDGVNLMRQQWADGKGGEVMWSPTTIRMALIQWRPEYQDPKLLSDVRVRRALAHAWDTQQAIDELNYGQGIKTATVTPPTVPFYAEIEKVITKYDYDPRRVGELMNQVGYTRGADGYYADAAGQKFSVGVWSSSGDKNIQEAAFYVDGAKKAGIDARQEIASVQQLNDGMYRATASGISIRGGGSYSGYLTSEVARPENRWAGGNRSGYSNPVYDRLYDQYLTTLDTQQRVSLLAQAEKVFTEDVPAIMQYFQNTATARVGALKGPKNTPAPGVGGGGVSRIHEWTWEP
jgi:peptide/nickel transport system substrate-binding protein